MPKAKAKAKAGTLEFNLKCHDFSPCMSGADNQIHTELPTMDLPGLSAFKDALVVRVCMHWVNSAFSYAIDLVR